MSDDDWLTKCYDADGKWLGFPPGTVICGPGQEYIIDGAGKPQLQTAEPIANNGRWLKTAPVTAIVETAQQYGAVGFIYADLTVTDMTHILSRAVLEMRQKHNDLLFFFDHADDLAVTKIEYRMLEVTTSLAFLERVIYTQDADPVIIQGPLLYRADAEKLLPIFNALLGKNTGAKK